MCVQLLYLDRSTDTVLVSNKHPILIQLKYNILSIDFVSHFQMNFYFHLYTITVFKNLAQWKKTQQQQMWICGSKVKRSLDASQSMKTFFLSYVLFLWLSASSSILAGGFKVTYSPWLLSRST